MSLFAACASGANGDLARLASDEFATFDNGEFALKQIRDLNRVRFAEHGILVHGILVHSATLDATFGVPWSIALKARWY